MENPAVIDRYLCLSVDVVGYGRHDDAGQQAIQRQLIGLLDAAALRAGLDRERWLRQAQGDAELCLIPAGEVLPRVVGLFCLELEALLHNGSRLRLRLAIDDGPVRPGANGYSGRAVIGVSRLINSGPIRRALKVAEHAPLAIIVSSTVFRDWIESGHASLEPGLFRRVRVTEKEADEDAWLWVPDVNTHLLDLADPPKAASPEPGQRAETRFEGPVRIEGGVNVFGIRNG